MCSKRRGARGIEPETFRRRGQLLSRPPTTGPLGVSRWSMGWYRWVCTASCGWHMRCIVVRGDAWPLLLSPCNTGKGVVAPGTIERAVSRITPTSSAAVHTSSTATPRHHYAHPAEPYDRISIARAIAGSSQPTQPNAKHRRAEPHYHTEFCRLAVVCVNCRCSRSFVFLGGARRLELSPCNTDQASDGGAVGMLCM